MRALALLLVSGVALAGVKKGDAAPEFDLAALDGKRVSLSSLRGKVVLLDFWASWCAPCKQELPELEKLKAAYEAKGVVFVGVNIDKERANAAQLAARLKLTFPVLLDPDGKIADQYDLPLMPTSFLIDRTGVVRFVHAGFRPEDVAKLRRELDELSAAK